MKYNLEDRFVSILIMAGLLFSITYFFSLFYILGDQIHYKEIFEIIQGLSLKETYLIYNEKFHTNRVTHLLFNWIMSSLSINKNIAFSLLDCVLGVYCYFLFRKMGASILVCLILIFTNYYFWVTYLTAETLRISMIFFVLSLYYKEKIFVHLFFSLLAFVSHQSSILMILGIWGVYVYQNIFLIYKIKKYELITYLILIILFIFYLIYFKTFLLYKINFYVNLQNNLDYKSLLLFFFLLLISIFYSKKIIIPIILYLPCFATLLLIGGSRVNMLIFFLSLNFIITENKGHNLVFFVLSFYCLYKTYIFLGNVYFFGHGFQS